LKSRKENGQLTLAVCELIEQKFSQKQLFAKGAGPGLDVPKGTRFSPRRPITFHSYRRLGCYIDIDDWCVCVVKGNERVKGEREEQRRNGKARESKGVFQMYKGRSQNSRARSRS